MTVFVTSTSDSDWDTGPDTMTSHTLADVVAAYEEQLRLQARRMLIEQSREESQFEAEERLAAQCRHMEIELQYIAQFTY